MHRTGSDARGFTLVELLIAMAITGILLIGIIALTGGVLRYTGQATAVNAMTAELNDVLGYIGLRLRSATQLVGEGDSVQLTASGSSFNCSIASSDGNCIAVVVPVVDRDSTTAAITGYELLAYRVTTADNWADDPGLPTGWDGANTPILLEYRAALACPSPCSSPPLAPSSVSANRVSFVAGDLVLVDSGGAAYSVFEIGSPSRATIRLRIQEITQIGMRSVPGDGPLELNVTRRQ